MATSVGYSKVGRPHALRIKSERLWLRELFAWLVSALLLAAIAIILGVENGKAKRTIQWGITLNALVAILLKIWTSSLTVPLSASLGQCKWNRVGAEMSLQEFASISDASQGTWASIKLVLRFRGG